MSNDDDEKKKTPPRVPVIHRKAERPTGRGPAYQVSPKTAEGAVSPHARFSANLARRIRDKGMTQAAFARACQLHLPEGERFGRDSVSGYVRKGHTPDPMRVKAMCAVLGCTEDELLEGSLVPVAGGEVHAPNYASAGLGEVRINIDQVLSLHDALAIAGRLADFEKDEDGLMLFSLDSDNVRLRVRMEVPSKVGLQLVADLEELYIASLPEGDDGT